MKFARIFSDFLENRCNLELLEISRFRFKFSMIITEIHLIFDLMFDSISFTRNFISNFHVDTTPGGAASIAQLERALGRRPNMRGAGPPRARATSGDAFCGAEQPA